MGEPSLPELGKVMLGTGKEVVVTRLPIGGFVAVRDALKDKDIVGIFRQASEAVGTDDDSMNRNIGLNILMVLPEVLLAFLKWTISIEGEGESIPMSDEFVNSIPAVDVPKIAKLCAVDITEIVGSVKNLISPVRIALAGQNKSSEEG